MHAHPPHVLDRPVWHALTARQAHVAAGGPLAVRLKAEYGMFAAPFDDSPDSLAALAALLPEDGGLVLMEAVPPTLGVGRTASRAPCHQMVAEALTPGEAGFPIVELTDADAPEMLALATLTKPGPFVARTHELGRFVGIKQRGRLVAMAGERLRPEGFTEVSGVCTHPDHRGRGYAGGLVRAVAGAILARGETPFLHTFSSNASAIALYESLGFVLRRVITMKVISRA
jgi:predicted GNAT family acetyltransferase